MYAILKNDPEAYIADVLTGLIFQNPSELDPEDLTDESLVKRVQLCFSNDDPNKCFEKLLELNTTWGAETASQLKALNKSAVENWFRLTRLATKESLESLYRYEVTASSMGTKTK
jgi:hypothetical protein